MSFALAVEHFLSGPPTNCGAAEIDKLIKAALPAANFHRDADRAVPRELEVELVRHLKLLAAKATESPRHCLCGFLVASLQFRVVTMRREKNAVAKLAKFLVVFAVTSPKLRRDFRISNLEKRSESLPDFMLRKLAHLASSYAHFCSCDADSFEQHLQFVGTFVLRAVNNTVKTCVALDQFNTVVSLLQSDAFTLCTKAFPFEAWNTQCVLCTAASVHSVRSGCKKNIEAGGEALSKFELAWKLHSLACAALRTMDDLKKASHDTQCSLAFETMRVAAAAMSCSTSDNSNVDIAWKFFESAFVLLRHIDLTDRKELLQHALKYSSAFFGLSARKEKFETALKTLRLQLFFARKLKEKCTDRLHEIVASFVALKTRAMPTLELASSWTASMLLFESKSESSVDCELKRQLLRLELKQVRLVFSASRRRCVRQEVVVLAELLRQCSSCDAKSTVEQALLLLERASCATELAFLGEADETERFLKETLALTEGSSDVSLRVIECAALGRKLLHKFRNTRNAAILCESDGDVFVLLRSFASCLSHLKEKTLSELELRVAHVAIVSLAKVADFCELCGLYTLQAVTLSLCSEVAQTATLIDSDFEAKLARALCRVGDTKADSIVERLRKMELSPQTTLVLARHLMTRAKEQSDVEDGAAMAKAVFAPIERKRRRIESKKEKASLSDREKLLRIEALLVLGSAPTPTKSDVSTRASSLHTALQSLVSLLRRLGARVPSLTRFASVSGNLSESNGSRVKVSDVASNAFSFGFLKSQVSGSRSTDSTPSEHTIEVSYLHLLSLLLDILVASAEVAIDTGDDAQASSYLRMAESVASQMKVSARIREIQVKRALLAAQRNEFSTARELLDPSEHPLTSPTMLCAESLSCCEILRRECRSQEINEKVDQTLLQCKQWHQRLPDFAPKLEYRIHDGVLWHLRLIQALASNNIRLSDHSTDGVFDPVARARSLYARAHTVSQRAAQVFSSIWSCADPGDRPSEIKQARVLLLSALALLAKCSHPPGALTRDTLLLCAELHGRDRPLLTFACLDASMGLWPRQEMQQRVPRDRAHFQAARKSQQTDTGENFVDFSLFPTCVSDSPEDFAVALEAMYRRKLRRGSLQKSRIDVVFIALNSTTTALMMSRFSNNTVLLYRKCLQHERFLEKRRRKTVGFFAEAGGEFAQIMAAAKASTQDAVKATNESMRREWWRQRYDLDDRLQQWLQRVEDELLGAGKLLLKRERHCAEIDEFLQTQLNSAVVCSERQKEWVRLLIRHLHSLETVPDDFVALQRDVLEKPAHEFAVFCERLKTSFRRRPLTLVLSRELQNWPWESLPCLRNTRAAQLSRVPCLDFLLRRLPSPLVNVAKTYYVLNPKNDLTASQERFEVLLKQQLSWTGLVGKPPLSDDILQALRRNDVFVYIGHAAGERYCDIRTLAKARSRSVTLLFGCSSGLMRQRGDFDCASAAHAHLVAGAPAVVANLWDVTDKDIDLYARHVIEGFLLPKQETAFLSSEVSVF
ncbi:MAG: hypothetical protein MHM6MM_001791 [Cercozoa sp. M6MM]